MRGDLLLLSLFAVSSANAQHACFSPLQITKIVATGDDLPGDDVGGAFVNNVELAASGTNRVAIALGTGLSTNGVIWVTTNSDPSSVRIRDRQMQSGISISAKPTAVQAALFDWPLEAFESGATGFPSAVSYHKIDAVIEGQSVHIATSGADVPDFEANWESLRDAKIPDNDNSPFWRGEVRAFDPAWDSFDALAFGSAAEVGIVLASGQSLSNGTRLTDRDPIIRYSVSPDGAEVMAVVRTVDNSAADTALIFADALGQDVRVLGEQSGGIGRAAPGWFWNRFQHISLTKRAWNCGVPTWFASGQATGPAGQRWVIVRDGQLALIEGQDVCDPKFSIRGPVMGLDSNTSGDIASIWVKPTGNGVNRPAPVVLVNDVPLIGCGASLPAVSGQAFRKVSHIFPTVAISDREEDGATSIYLHVRVATDEDMLVNGLGHGEVIRVVVQLEPESYCIADFNDDDVVNQQDLTLFVLAWIERSVDVNCDDTTDESDLTDFLAAWQIGC
ncbi:MAG TPA: hypothetical protein VK157_01110 [Phycisphaerales bacterium]|nr:hypothetical protein [Phycisphaerales bacterium]